MEKYIVEEMKKTDVDPKFVENFSKCVVGGQEFIAFDEVKEWIGYKKKCTVQDILNTNLNFIEGQDYKIIKVKKEGICKPINEIYMTIDTIKHMCLAAQTGKGYRFRKYYIEMEKCFKKMAGNMFDKYMTNPIPEINQFDIDDYRMKEVFYLIKMKGNIYKYGVTQNIEKRLKEHKSLLDFEYLIKCWLVENRTTGKKIEDALKSYTGHHGIKDTYKKATEIFKTDNIDKVTLKINEYVDKYVTEYKNKFKDNDIEQKKELVEKMIILMDKCKNNGMDTNIIKNFIEVDNDVKETKKQEQIEETTRLKLCKDDCDCDDCKDVRICLRCEQYRTEEEFGINEKTKWPYRQCIKCRQEGKIVDKKIYNEKKERVLAKNREYYKKNASEILYKKKKKEDQKLPTNDNEAKCSKCRKIKDKKDFYINTFNNTLYKECKICRDKKKCNKDNKDINIVE